MYILYMDEKKVYPISVVSQKTGISPHVIRKWELRYNFPIPERTESNRRLYSEYDIALLQKALSMKSQGFRINDIIGILNSHTSSGVHNANGPDISGSSEVLELTLDTVNIELQESFRPGVVCGEDKSDFLYVVMPVSL